MHIAITGSSGNIGSLLIKFLNKNVKLLCFYKSNKPKINNNKNIKCKHDFSKKPLKNNLGISFDAIIHLANQNNEDPDDIIVNQKILINLIKSFKKYLSLSIFHLKWFMAILVR